MEQNNTPTTPNKGVYILSANWLEKWKTYMECLEDISKRETLELLSSIDPSNLLINKSSLIDPDPNELYSNFQLKPDLVEKKDFFIITEEFWQYLYKLYGGVPIKRITYKESDNTSNISVETWLQKVCFFLARNDV